MKRFSCINYRVITHVFLALGLITGFSVCAQEVESDLMVNPALITRPVQRSSGDERGGGSLDLPFFDDFSRYSLPSDDPMIPSEWQRWSDTLVYINSTLAVSPPTVGVATFDGLNARGYPHDFTDEYTYGPADTLTSLPIDLSLFAEEDNVYLTFFVQRGGIGNPPDEEDSLVVEFYSPFGAGGWFHVWSLPGDLAGDFQQVFIRVENPEYFLDGFRFRFRNYATLSGAYDHWHLDYVQLRQGIDPNTFAIDDVAMQYPNYTFLEEYAAMPWTHYLSDPQSFMADAFGSRERNLGPTENIVTGYSVTYDGAEQEFPDQDIFPSSNGFSEFTRNINLNGFTYDPDVSDTTAVFDVSVYVKPTDIYPQNDTARFQQVFTNYYAFDDGSAERAYAVEAAGANVAVRHRAEIADSLLGVFIHWIPYGNDPSDETFLLRVWGDAGGAPGSELIENFSFHPPRYYDDGYNVFSYYEFDQAVFVEGTFYVGWVQPNATRLNVGNDKNTNTNPARLFYNLGLGQPWQQSAISGSVMIRPVFKAGMSEVWNFISEEIPSDILRIYPNPVNDVLNIAYSGTDQLSVRLYDIAGREVYSSLFNETSRHIVDMNSLARGTYILTVSEKESGRFFRKPVIRQ